MAGYMRLLGKEVLDAFPMRVLNLHPALLPSFRGAHGIADAFDYGVKVTGVTVHFADEEFDRGPIIAQMPVRIEESDTVETLEAKIHAVEHVLYPDAIKLVAEGRVVVEGRKARIVPPPPPGDALRDPASREPAWPAVYSAFVPTNPSWTGASFTPNPARTIAEICSGVPWWSLSWSTKSWPQPSPGGRSNSATCDENPVNVRAMSSRAVCASTAVSSGLSSRTVRSSMVVGHDAAVDQGLGQLPEGHDRLARGTRGTRARLSRTAPA